MFSRRPSKRRLAEMCRKLAAMLEAGVTARKAFKTLERGPGLDHTVMQNTSLSLEAGDTVTEALSTRKGYFPPLFLNLVEVGERTGTLDRVLTHLAEYYENMHELSRKVVRSMIYPACIITLAILVTALLKYVVTGVFSDIRGEAVAPDAGRIAAIRHLVFWFGGMGLLIAAYVFCRTVLRGAVPIDRVLLRVPVVGKALRRLAVARFTWAFQLAYAAGLGVPETVERAMRATNNAAFTSTTDIVLLEIRSGTDLRTSLETVDVFPDDTLEMIEVAETSGKLEESMGRIAKNAFADADFAIQGLTRAFGWLVWAIAAGVAVYYIIWFYAQYAGVLRSLTP